jgi:uncharacterized Ntn-hydrolase superfamily protein
VLNFTLDGIPFVYNGQEAGARNATSHNTLTPIDWTLERRPQPMGLYRRLIELRKREPALAAGEVEWVENSEPDSVVSYIRRTGGDEILVAANASNRLREVTVNLPVADWPLENLMEAKPLGSALAPGRLVFRLNGFGYVVGKRRKPQPMAWATAPARPVHTFSIVARDPKTGEMGVAVQSHWFSVGSIVAWAEAGVGAIATQSFVDPSYGKLGLEMMKTGKSAPETLKALLAGDDGREVRQVAMVDWAGRIAAHTGANDIAMAGHETGDQFSVQANMMLSDKVWPAMAKAYREARGDLADRLMAALDAAQAVGGDVRGKQSAALVVVKPQSTGKPWVDRLFDLRVDDHAEPLAELRRLLTLQRAYNHMNEGDLAMERKDNPGALGHYSSAARLVPDNLEMRYWHAVALVNMGRLQDSLPLFREVFSKDPNWRVLTERLPKAGQLPNDPKLLQAILRQ